MYAELLLRREDGRLCHVDEGIADLLGWTAEEVMACPIQDLVTEASCIELQETYFRGPPNTYCSCRLVVDALHKDGHIVRMCLLMFCRYDLAGALVEAWGCARRHSELDMLEAWWAKARPEARKAVVELAEAYAAV